MRYYNIDEIFYSIQGEGYHVGKPVVFVRFAGCNLNCEWCDTPRRPATVMSAKNILWFAEKESLGKCRSVVFTGGEPAMQLTEELVANTFYGWWTAVETNGTLPLPYALSYITVSPKPGQKLDKSITFAQEMRYPIKEGDKIPDLSIVSNYNFLSPIFDGKKLVQANVDWAYKLVLQNAGFKLSLQMHKLGGFR